MSADNPILSVLLNDKIVVEIDRNILLSKKQRTYLDNIDGRMKAGIQLAEDFIAPPNPLQKAQYVANQMVNGILEQDLNKITAMATYLAVRLVNLKQVICVGHDNQTGIKIEFIYAPNLGHTSEISTQEQVIQFFNPKDYVSKNTT